MRRADRARGASSGRRGGFVLDSHALLAYFEAHEVVSRIDILPITLEGVDRTLVQAAAALEAEHPIAYADALAAATASALQVPVVTGDPESRRLEPHIQVHGS